ncbi:MAG TPA: methyl-accepting chemotaxis protein [Methanoregulaceae archaeon]|nr:methyl-accepting chemotaxis protein [Methanoregulaceae archaeon]
MSFIDDMKIGKKLLGGFGIVLLMMIGIAVGGYIGLSTSMEFSDDLYENHMLAAEHLAASDAAIEKYRGNLYRYVYVPSSRAEMKTAMDSLVVTIDDQMAEYAKTDLNAEERANLEKFNTAFKKMQSGYAQIMKDADANNMQAVAAQLDPGSETMKARAEAIADIEWATGQLNTMAADLATKMDETNSSSVMLSIIVAVAAVIIGLGIALYLSKSITSPLGQTVTNIREMGNGHFGNRLRLARKDEIGEMAAAMDQFSDDLQNQVVGTMKKIAVGDLTTNVPVKDSKDEIGPALVQMTAAINLMVHDVNALAKAIDEGKVNTRADATKHQGDYRKIVEGVNNVAINFYNPMKEAIRVAGEYAKQDFTARFDDKVKAEGDMVKFKDALNNVGESVSKAIRAVNIQTADLSAAAEEAAASLNEIATGANQIASGTQKVNDNAEKSSQGIAQVLKAMEDMSAAVEEVTSSMENVSSQSKQTNEASRNGATLVANVEQSMTDISASTETVVSIVGEIERQMADITKIVELIRDLANQTNLLALNAAIEAARAGDAGRGFAVVASEVKSLAEESRVSAEKIEQMITELNTATRNAAAATGGSREQVTRGAQMTREALEAFNTIKESAEKVASAASEVAAAAEEQAATTEEITASIHEVRAQVEGTSKEASNSAAATEEATASINEINKVVDNLNRIVENVSREMAKFTV